MTTARGWRWAGLALIAVVSALFASFNTGERVALNLGFTILYQVPLVTLIFVAFLAGMVTMFLLGLSHDLRVRRALREAGFGEPIASHDEPPPVWEESPAPSRPELTREHLRSPEIGERAVSPPDFPAAEESSPADHPPPGARPDWEPPPR